MNVPVVILCGGQGTRLREETEYKPKPMVTVGKIPILIHIMNWFKKHGFNDFILCSGYKEEMIRAWFETNKHDFNVDIEYTGEETMTGARLKEVEPLLSSRFMLAYGDGLCDVDIKKLFAFHCSRDTIGTVTGVHPISRYGHLTTDENDVATSFVEKPKIYNQTINGGFYVFELEFLDWIKKNDKTAVLERNPLVKLAEKRQLSVFRHEGFWMGMDTYKDYLDLNKMWREKKLRWLKPEESE
jgi:glucose-1-phosphate cytidylyltransferase